MEQKLIVPRFANETEEAAWWFENQDLAFEEFERAGNEGRLGRGTALRLANEAEATMIALDAEDVERARSLAERNGVEFQTYVRRVMHRALLQEERRA
jgi:predicted DNA binding CopG/RHH family protein